MKTKIYSYNKSEYIEFLRILACWLVLFHHSGNLGSTLYVITDQTYLYWIYMFISFSGNVAVPIFFMITGVCLLKKDESIKEIYVHRVLRMVIVLIAISICYYIWDCRFNGVEFNLSDFLKKIYTNGMSSPLWYLYSYIGVLVMLPLLCKLVKVMSESDYIYLIIWQIILVGLIPLMEHFVSRGIRDVSLTKYFTIPFVTSANLFYVLIGYFFGHVLNQKVYTLKNVIIGILISFFVISVSCLVIQLRINNTGIKDFNIQNCMISIPAMTIFYSCKYFFTNHRVKDKTKSLICFFGGTTFGIYLMERMLREKTVFIYNRLFPIIHRLPACIVWCTCAFLIGAIITSILKRVPIVKKFL